MGVVPLGLLVLVGFPFLPTERGKGKEGEKEKEKGGRAPTPCPIRFGKGGGACHPWPFSPLSTKAQ